MAFALTAANTGIASVRRGLAGVVLLLGLPMVAAQAAGREGRIFTIGNYPVEASAANAVAAKERAISDGQQAAFRSLLKRLVPVTAYRRLGALGATKAGDLVESFAIRSERNSSTEYIASYDFVFQPDGVRRLLDGAGIPYLDRQAPPVVLVPVYRLSPESAGHLPPTFSNAAGSDAWLYAWKALDLAGTLTPLDVQPLKHEVHADTVKALASGDLGFFKTLAGAYATESIVLAVLEPEGDLKHLKVVLVGRDAVQNLYLKRSYRLDELDITYTAELAAVFSLAIIEGRWKAINVRGETATAASAPGGSSWSSPAASQQPPQAQPVAGEGGPLTIAVRFNGMGEWTGISRQLAATPEISGLDVLGLSARSARVALSYPGGPERLALTLAGQGLVLEKTPQGWLLSRR